MAPSQEGESVFTFDLKEKIWGGVTFGLIVAAKIAFKLMHWSPKEPSLLDGILTPAQYLDLLAILPIVAAYLCFLTIRRWLNRRRHVEGKPHTGILTIYVAELEGDDKKGNHRSNVIRMLMAELGSAVRVLRAPFVLQLDEAGDPHDDATAGNRKARKYLDKKHGDLLIWGVVLSGPPQVLEIRFASSAHDSSDGRRFSYSEKLELSAEFNSEVRAAIAALALNFSTPSKMTGRFVADLLIPAAEKLGTLLKGMRSDANDKETALLFYSYALLEERIGDQRHDNRRLKSAIAAYRQLERIWTRDDQPRRWAGIQNNLGNIYQTLGEQHRDGEILAEAIRHFRLALETTTRTTNAIRWATLQNNLGNSLARLGERADDSIQLREALTKMKAALEVFTRDHNLELWASISGNIGNVLREVGIRESRPELLEEAQMVLTEAGNAIPRKQFPLVWATIQNNCANAVFAIGMSRRDPDRIQAAMKLYRASLEERGRDRSQVDWSMTLFNVGNCQLQLADMTANREFAREALATFDEALEGLTMETTSLQFGLVEANRGTALELLVETDGLERLVQARDAYQAATIALTATGNPRGHRIATQNLERVMGKLHRLQRTEVDIGNGTGRP